MVVTTTMTSFFETSKLCTSIILALVGKECRKPRLEPEKAIRTHCALPSLGCHALYICILFVYFLFGRTFSSFRNLFPEFYCINCKIPFMFSLSCKSFIILVGKIKENRVASYAPREVE
jgi:hypothetical protein